MCCRKGGPLSGLEKGLLSNTQKWIVRGGTRADKAKGVIGKGPPGQRAGGWGSPGELLCHVARSLRVYGDGVSFQVVSGQSFDSGASWRRMQYLTEMDASEEDSGRWKDIWHLLLTFPKLFWLVVPCGSMFLPRASCCKNHSHKWLYGAWPGWAVSVSVFPLTCVPKRHFGVTNFAPLICIGKTVYLRFYAILSFSIHWGLGNCPCR